MAPIKASKIDLIDDRSDLVEEVMTRKPQWMIRYGTGMIFIVIVVLLFLSWVIKYPDIITARGYITSKYAPVKVIAQTTGSLHYLVTNDSIYAGGQTIGYVKSTTEYNQAMALVSLLSRYNASDFSSIDTSFIAQLKSYNKLGALQQELDVLIDIAERYSHHIFQDPVGRELEDIGGQIRKSKTLLNHKKGQLVLLKSEDELTQKDHNRNIELYRSKVISEKEMDASSRNAIRSKNTVQQQEAEILNIDLNLAALFRSVTQLKNIREEELGELRRSIKRGVRVLSNKLNQWERDHVLKAPISGKVIIHRKLTTGVYLFAGEHVFTIAPVQSSTYTAVAQSPSFNSGKMRIGQDVNILLDDYPYQEYGVLKGKVSKYSIVPKENFYLVEVDLSSDSLITNFKKQLKYKPEMTGTVEIITEDLRFIERISYHFKYLFANSIFIMLI